MALAAPKADLWPRWETHDPDSTLRVDHGPWNSFLSAYLVTYDPSGVHRVRYGEVSPADRKALQGYLEQLQATPVSRLNRDEQMAYWINFYNALTLEVILEHYPVASIRRINISPGFFTRGPWDAPLVEVEGESLTLNDIEHRILRPIWQDPRIHYAVNCASIGCPNLQRRAFTAEDLEDMLDAAAHEFINHPRAVRFDGRRLRLSSIFDWFSEDFGRNEREILEHVAAYAEPPLAETLRSYSGRISYDYDWALNE
ncbi:DUF547 domain-containing protein [Desulfonatronum parangueonense]